MLWAWERPEDLSFLDCRQAGVAVLAKTLTLANGRMEVAARRQPIVLPDGCPTVAVVRIEANAAETGEGLLEPVTRELVEAADRPDIHALQIDFDALASQRPFYRSLLERLKPEMPPGAQLSITALTSWCLSDNWLDGLPIDEAVPMLFQMGSDGDTVRAHLARGSDFTAVACRTSLGLSTDEWPARAPGGRRVYIFHSQSWLADVVSNSLKRAEALR